MLLAGVMNYLIVSACISQAHEVVLYGRYGLLQGMTRLKRSCEGEWAARLESLVACIGRYVGPSDAVTVPTRAPVVATDLSASVYCWPFQM